MRNSRQLTAKEALARAEELCARAEHCSSEIREKLYQWGIGASDSDRIITSLIERRFIDDIRFTSAFVRDKIEYAGWGRRKIALALYQKRIDREIIDTALSEIDEERYTERIRDIVRRKALTIADADTYEGRTRLYRFAASRGFEPDLVAKVIHALREEG